MSKATVLVLITLVLIGGGALLVNREFRDAQQRPAVQRLDSQRRLCQFAAAIAAYRDRHHAWPDRLLSLVHDQRLGFGANLVRGGGSYRYRPPPAGAREDAVVMWSESMHRAVRAGEAWGAEGEVAARDQPAVSYVLNAALAVEELDAAAWRQRVPGTDAHQPPRDDRGAGD
jgi:hypothetical protein